jgi:hypothetical protein
MQDVNGRFDPQEDILNAVEDSIITVNLPGRQAVYVIDQDDADLLLAVKMDENFVQASQ